MYDAVRADVERRVLDGIRGALAARPSDPPMTAAATGLMVAFNFLADQRYTRRLTTTHPAGNPDPVTVLLTPILDGGGFPRARILTAAWREALLAVVEGVKPAVARAALHDLIASGHSR